MSLAGALPPGCILVGKTDWPHAHVMCEELGKKKEKCAEAARSDYFFVERVTLLRVKGAAINNHAGAHM